MMALIITLNSVITTFSVGANLLLSTKHSIQGKDLAEFVEIKENFVVLIKETQKLAAYSVSVEGDYQSWRIDEMDTFLRSFHMQILKNPNSFTLAPHGVITNVFTDGRILGINSRLLLDQPIMSLVHKDDLQGLFGILKIQIGGKVTVRWKILASTETIESLTCDYKWVEIESLICANTILIIPKDLYPTPVTMSVYLQIPFLNRIEKSVAGFVPGFRFKLLTIVKYWQFNVMNFKQLVENFAFKNNRLEENTELSIEKRPSKFMTLAQNSFYKILDWIALKPLLS
jgi:hypothetical protein